jgi:MFS family permease
MEKQTIIKLVIPFVFIASIYSGVFYNFAVWFNYNILETYWSFFVNSSTLTNAITIAFITFIIVLLISTNFVNKIVKKPLIIFCIILIGFCCIYISFISTVEWLFLYFILMGISAAYLTPCLLKLTNEALPANPKKESYKYSFIILVILWLLISGILYGALGILYPLSTWRFLYLITGIINIAAAPLINII